MPKRRAQVVPSPTRQVDARCAGCGTVLYEPGTTARTLERRLDRGQTDYRSKLPCPSCGSLDRRVHLTISGTGSMAATAALNATGRVHDLDASGAFGFEANLVVTPLPANLTVNLNTLSMTVGAAPVTTPALDAWDAIPLAELRRAAMEYNLGRHHGRSLQLEVPYRGDLEPVVMVQDPDAPLSPNTLRVVSVLMGAWVAAGDTRCNPARGKHPAGCVHRENVVPFTRRALALATFGHGGGSQLVQVADALNEAAQNTTEVYYTEAGRGWFRQVSHVLSLREVGRVPSYALPGDLPLDATGYLSWDPFLHRSLLNGNYQSIPMELVRSLSGTDFLVWLAILSRKPTADLLRHDPVGESRVYSVTGKDPLLSLVRLGLHGRRPDKVRAALEKAAENGNALARDSLGVVLDVEPRARGLGLNVVIRKVARVGSRRQNLPSGTAKVDASHGKTGRHPRQKWTRSELKTEGVDGVLDGSIDGVLDAGNPRGKPQRKGTTEGVPDPATVSSLDDLAEYVRTVQEWPTVKARVRATLADWSERHRVDGDPASGYRWVAERVAEAPDRHSSWGHVVEAERRWRRDRRAEVAEDRQEAVAPEPRDPSPSEAAFVWSTLQARYAQEPKGSPAPTPDPEPTPVQDDGLTPEERGRRAAIVAIRNGLQADLAEVLRRRYAITDGDLAGD